MKKIEIEFIVNGKKRRIFVKPNDLLINIIRNDLYLTGVNMVVVLGNVEPVPFCWMVNQFYLVLL